jgi:hypothetical protein
MDKVAIIGFVNRIKRFPTFLITVVLVDGKYYSRWPMPGDELILILDVQKEEDLADHNYWKDTSSRLLDLERDEFVFAFSQEQVIIGTAEELIREMQKQLEIKVLPQDVLDELDLTISELKNSRKSQHYFK